MPATDAYWRNLKKLHVWFAASAVALLAVTFWMMADDHRREYFEYQRTFFELQALKAEAKIEAIRTPEFKKEIAQLEQEVKEERAKRDDRREEIDELERDLEQKEFDFSLAETAVRRLRSSRDVARANRDLAVRDEKPQSEIDALQAEFERQQRNVLEQEIAVERLKGERDTAQEALAEANRGFNDAEARLKEKQQAIEQLQALRNRVQPEGWGQSFKRRIMEWPVLQGFNSHLQVRQDWLPDLHVTKGMSKTARFDRCRTCHLGSDVVEAGNVPAYPFGKPSDDNLRTWIAENKFPHPYATHPNPDLYMTASSPHPVSTFGCTVCHDGNGSGTSFQNAEHGPNNPHQAAKWKKEHGYHSNHFWEYPMQPARLLESSCIKCHHHVEELGHHPEYQASAPKVYSGYRVIQKYGCFGCHEVHGFEAGKSIGPDLRLEPNYTESAIQFRWLIGRREKPSPTGVSADSVAEQLEQIINQPENSAAARARLTERLENESKAKGEALRDLARDRSLSPEERKQKRAEIGEAHLSAEALGLIDQFKDVAQPGKYRKVGPSLRYVRHKLPQDFIPYWTEEPKRFRPTTNMPQFFKLTNLQDAHGGDLSAAELIAVSQYLYDKSQEFETLPLREGAEPPNAERGAKYFAEKGCLACHSHGDVKDSKADFGPDLTLTAAKVKRDEDNPEFSSWLYTWIRDPQRYHKRSKMPHLFLDLESESAAGEDGESKTTTYDPAADITAYLLRESDAAGTQRAEYEARTRQLAETAFKEVRMKIDGVEQDVTPVDYLVRHFLRKALSKSHVDAFFERPEYPVGIEAVKGDEIELAEGTLGKDLDPANNPEHAAEWRNVKLRYLGRRTISRYGCYACHDIPGFERSRPIGTTLQNWGRKDRSQLAFEHISEYLHHHGEPDGSSTHERARRAVNRAAEGSFENGEDREEAMGVAFFYDSLLHHGRAGFLWQKLRQPRSYDYEKIETKAYDERLRMPKFPFDEKEIEQVATFVLGLVAEPPADQYQYKPSGPAYARVEGERLLKKYNCTGCHMTDLPEVTYWANLGVAPFSRAAPDDPPLGHDLLMKMMPPRPVDATTTRTDPDDENVTQTKISFRGLRIFDPEEDPTLEDQHYFQNWEHLDVKGTRITPGPAPFAFSEQNTVSISPGRGGDFAEWLFKHLKSRQRNPDLKAANTARHRIPPVLYREGHKVQTPWLYQFLRNPHEIRPLAVLRMPRFNMSSHDAQTLANYFAAADGVPFPYQEVPQRSPAYIDRQNSKYRELLEGDPHPEYLSQAWKLLLNPELCRKCHSAGGNPAQQAAGPDAVRAPNLEYATDRLRPEWTLLWLSDPRWITPYTQMPVNFSKDKEQYPESFDGHGPAQVRAVRDALMNYHMLMEIHKDTDFKYPTGKDPTGNAGEQADPKKPAENPPDKKPPTRKQPANKPEAARLPEE